jgi:hypothetical protein
MAKKQHFKNEIIRDKVLQKHQRQGLESMRELLPSDIELKKGITGGAAYHHRKFEYKAVPDMPKRMKGGMTRNPLRRLGDAVATAAQQQQAAPAAPAAPAAQQQAAVAPPPPAAAAGRESPTGIIDMIDEAEFEAGLRGRGYSKGLKRFVGGARRAKLLGKEYGKKMYEMDDEMKELVGSGFFGKFLEGLKDAGKAFVFPIKTAAKIGSTLPLPPQLKAIATGVDALTGKVDDPIWVKQLKGKAKRGRPKTSVRKAFKEIEETEPEKKRYRKGRKPPPVEQMDDEEYDDEYDDEDDDEGFRPIMEGDGRRKKGKGLKGSPLQIQHPNVVGKGKRISPWIEHVKAYAKKHKIPYRDALKLSRDSYKK